MNLDKYYLKVKEMTKDSDEVLFAFFKTIELRLDKDIKEINKSDINECLKYAGHFHLGRLLVLLNVIE